MWWKRKRGNGIVALVTIMLIARDDGLCSDDMGNDSVSIDNNEYANSLDLPDSEAERSAEKESM